MKFSQIPVGALFEYQGKTYEKISPLLGACETSGQQKFIMRSADVKLRQDNKKTQETSTPTVLQTQQVLAAFEHFHANCEHRLDELTTDLDSQTIKNLRCFLETEKKRFLKAIS